MGALPPEEGAGNPTLLRWRLWRLHYTPRSVCGPQRRTPTAIWGLCKRIGEGQRFECPSMGKQAFFRPTKHSKLSPTSPQQYLTSVAGMVPSGSSDPASNIPFNITRLPSAEPSQGGNHAFWVSIEAEVADVYRSGALRVLNTGVVLCDGASKGRGESRPIDVQMTPTRPELDHRSTPMISVEREKESGVELQASKIVSSVPVFRK